MTEPVITVRGLTKYYQPRIGISSLFGGLGTKKLVKAVDGVSFSVMRGEIFGLVGESGSGKTTTGQLCVRALDPTSGSVLFDGVDLASLGGEKIRKLRRRLQMIYQDPFDAIDPRFKVFDVVAEGAIAHSVAKSKEQLEEMVSGILAKVGLQGDEILGRYPHQLSGGQRQRLAFARAAILSPDFVVADEPVSMLDASVKAEVLNSMLKLRDDFNISFMFITHDLSWARHVSDRIAVMYLGKIVEVAEADELVKNPLHPYTKALMAATPIPDPKEGRPKVMAIGEIPSAIDVPPGCSFHPRCPYAFDRCNVEIPELREIGSGHYVSCHLVN
jgi:peptide/nickel transport system ATP-binding protein